LLWEIIPLAPLRLLALMTNAVTAETGNLIQIELRATQIVKVIEIGAEIAKIQGQ